MSQADRDFIAERINDMLSGRTEDINNLEAYIETARIEAVQDYRDRVSNETASETAMRLLAECEAEDERTG